MSVEIMVSQSQIGAFPDLEALFTGTAENSSGAAAVGE